MSKLRMALVIAALLLASTPSAAQTQPSRRNGLEAAEAAVQQAGKAAAERAEQLHRVLQTQDSARNLIANMPDVLFGAGRYTLASGEKDKLARMSDILLAYPSFILDIGGYTDSVGSDDFNQRLSEKRAYSVRDFLIGRGVVASSIDAHGYGENQPVAINDTATGRQQNRRVELVVSGEKPSK